MSLLSQIQRRVTRGSLFALVVLSAGIAAVVLPTVATTTSTEQRSVAPSVVTTRQVTLPTKDLVYDPVTQRIYASVPSSAGGIGNSITVIDPVLGTVGASVSIGSEPGKLAISSNSQYIYASLDGVASVRRFDLATQTAGLQFLLGTGSSGTFYAEDMAVLPGQPNAIAISRKYLGTSPRHGGVGVYDNGVARPTTTATHTGSNVIEFSASAATLYGYNNETTDFGFRKMTVDASGVSVVSNVRNAISGFGVDIAYDNGLIYATNGQVINAETGIQVGRFSGVTFPSLVLPDSATNTVYFINGTGVTASLKAYDQTTFVQTGQLALTSVSGTPGSLIKWGSGGLAFRTSGNQVVLVSTSEILSLFPTPIPSPTQVASGIVRLPLATSDLVYDPNTAKVYATLPGSAGTFGNSIAGINPVTGTMDAPVFIGSEPGKVAVSANRQFLYAGLNGAAGVRRFDIASQTAGLQFNLGADSLFGPFTVEDIAVLPNDPNAVAISRRNNGFSPKHEGVGIYDSGVVRANATPDHTGSNVIEFSSSAGTLYGYNNESTEFGFRKMAVSPSGVSVTSVNSSLISGFNVDIKFDNGRIYSSNGRVIDPEAGTILGTFPGLFFPPAFVTDSTLNRAFFVDGDTLRTFNLTTFQPAGFLKLSGVTGTPGSLVRWGTDGLAFRTSDNNVYFVQSSLLSSAPSLLVNSLGDQPDFSVGDGRCDVDVSLGNGDQCSLRAAIQESNASATDGAIAFDVSLSGQTIVLNTALDAINNNLTISGPGAASLGVQRNPAGGTPEFRIFTINAGKTVTMSGIAVRNGLVNGVSGGGISNSGSLTLNGVTVSGNTIVGSGAGGGVHNLGTLTVNDCLVSGNVGGGIYSGVVGSNTSATINSSVISGNTGSGISNNGGNSIATMVINNSTISGNNANLGGGVFNGAGSFTSRGFLTINNSTISGNSAGSGGGGLYSAAVFGNAATEVTINNSTISGNVDNATSGGGGILHLSNGSGSVATMTINNGTIFGNGTNAGNGGGIRTEVLSSVTNLNLRNTIVAGNLRSSGTVTSDISGTVAAASSSNLIGDGTGMTGVSDGSNGNQVGTSLSPINPLLGALGNNGGPTQTHAPLPGSPAIDAGDNCVLDNSCTPLLAAALTTDQRGPGFSRGTDGNGDGVITVDVGAVEIQGILVTNTNDAGAGSLRQAILDANAAVSTDTIRFQLGLTGIISLDTALPDINGNVSILGPGANVLTIQRSTAIGTPNFRIFTIGAGATVNISGLTITNGRTTDGANNGSSGDFGGAIRNSGTLTVTDSTISGNQTGNGGSSSFGGQGGFGGGIYNEVGATLTIASCMISGNQTGNGGFGTNSNGGFGGHGGGIYNAGMLTMSDSTLSGNHTGNAGNGGGNGGNGGAGGGVFNFGTMLLINNTISSNQTGNGGDGGDVAGIGGPGGGVSNGETLTIIGNTITSNLTGNGGNGIGSFSQGGGGGSGGGVSNGGTLTLTNSTISNNQIGTAGTGTFGGVGGPGGGVFNGRILTLTNSTIAGNKSGNGGNGTNNGSHGGLGGGIYNEFILALTNATVSGNQTGIGGGTAGGGSGGGIYNCCGPTNNIKNTIVANNTIASNGLGPDLFGTFNSQDYNLIEDPTGATINGNTDHNITGQDPRLGPLANNGGPTQTLALLAGSPALDAADNCVFDNSCTPALSSAITTDQRGTGFSRKVDGSDGDTTDTVDIGAFEAQVSVQDIADLSIPEDNSLVLFFHVGGAASITGVTATSSNATLVPNDPEHVEVSGSGSVLRLVIVPLANESGSSTITVTVNGNNSQTMTDTFLLTVNSVNDAPSFAGSGQTVNENAGAQTVNNWATNLSAGPANESAQTLTFVIVNNSNPGLFAVPPAVSPTGTLTYTPATGASGLAAITIAVMDNGGTANGGIDTSPSQTFNFTVQDGGALQFNSSTFSRAEDGGNAVVTVTRTGGSAGEARVNYATSNGTATAGQDYTSASGTLIFANGITTQTFNVATSNDDVDEPDETINLTLTNAAGTGSLGTPATAVLTINDNDAIPGLAIDNPAVNEGNTGTATVAFTVTLSGPSSQTVTVNYATANDTATAGSDYVAASGTLTFLPLETTKSINITVNGDIVFEPQEQFFVNLSSPVNATINEGQGGALINNDDAQGGFIAFSQSVYTVPEGGGFITITVNRTNDISGAATVQYFTREYADSAATAPCNTVSNFASSRCDYTSASGTLRFAPGETTKTFIVLISQDSFEEDPESTSLNLSSPTGGALLGNPATAELKITDDATEPATNPIDSADAFVRQHYHDFLNREPDAAGLAFWSNQITECQQPGATCSAEVRRINVSAAFFLSIEFQQTGYLAYRFYKSAYGNISGAPVPVRFSEFLPDTQQLGKDVVIGQPGADQQLETNKVAYALDFVTRSRFTTAYSTTLTPAQFVDMLFANAGVTPSTADRNAAINEFGGAGNTADTAARARALRRVAENSILIIQESNKAFVLMQYFGYLRRNPYDPPEAGLNFDGYNFWLGKLNEFNGNFVDAEMVKAFIISAEYRHRFGP